MFCTKEKIERRELGVQRVKAARATNSDEFAETTLKYAESWEETNICSEKNYLHN